MRKIEGDQSKADKTEHCAGFGKRKLSIFEEINEGGKQASPQENQEGHRKEKREALRLRGGGRGQLKKRSGIKTHEWEVSRTSQPLKILI